MQACNNAIIIKLHTNAFHQDSVRKGKKRLNSIGSVSRVVKIKASTEKNDDRWTERFSVDGTAVRGENRWMAEAADDP